VCRTLYGSLSPLIVHTLKSYILNILEHFAGQAGLEFGPGSALFFNEKIYKLNVCGQNSAPRPGSKL
jgi:hypothetical protein